MADPMDAKGKKNQYFTLKQINYITTLAGSVPWKAISIWGSKAATYGLFTFPAPGSSLKPVMWYLYHLWVPPEYHILSFGLLDTVSLLGHMSFACFF